MQLLRDGHEVAEPGQVNASAGVPVAFGIAQPGLRRRLIPACRDIVDPLVNRVVHAGLRLPGRARDYPERLVFLSIDCLACQLGLRCDQGEMTGDASVRTDR